MLACRRHGGVNRASPAAGGRLGRPARDRGRRHGGGAAAAVSLRRVMDARASGRDRPRHDREGHVPVRTGIHLLVQAALTAVVARRPGRRAGTRRLGSAPGCGLPGGTAGAATPATVGLAGGRVAAGHRGHRAGGGDGRPWQPGGPPGRGGPVAELGQDSAWWARPGSRRAASRRPAVPRGRPGPRRWSCSPG